MIPRTIVLYDPRDSFSEARLIAPSRYLADQGYPVGWAPLDTPTDSLGNYDMLVVQQYPGESEQLQEHLNRYRYLQKFVTVDTLILSELQGLSGYNAVTTPLIPSTIPVLSYIGAVDTYVDPRLWPSNPPRLPYLRVALVSQMPESYRDWEGIRFDTLQSMYPDVHFDYVTADRLHDEQFDIALIHDSYPVSRTIYEAGMCGAAVVVPPSYPTAQRLAQRTIEWENAIARLLEDPETRRWRSYVLRKHVLQERTLEKGATMLARTWMGLYAHGTQAPEVGAA